MNVPKRSNKKCKQESYMLSKYQCQKQNHVFCHISYKKIKLFEILKNRRCILAKAYKYYLLFWGFQVLLLIISLLILWNLFQNSWKQKPFASFRLTCKLQICQDIGCKINDWELSQNCMQINNITFWSIYCIFDPNFTIQWWGQGIL